MEWGRLRSSARFVSYNLNAGVILKEAIMRLFKLGVPFLVLLFAISMIVPTGSLADPVRINFSGQDGLFVTTSGKILPEGTMVIGGGFVSASEGDVGNDYKVLSVPVTFTYVFNEKLQGAVAIPITTSRDPDVGASESGMGDLQLTVKHTLQKIVKTESAAAGGLRIKLPLADDTNGLGTGDTDFGVFIAVEQDFGGVTTMMNVEYALLGGNAQNQINYAFGFEIPHKDKINFSIELVDQVPFTMSSNIGGDLLLGGINLDSGTSLNLGLGLGIGLNDGSTDYMILGNISYVL
jgi:hypothetical protein